MPFLACSDFKIELLQYCFSVFLFSSHYVPLFSPIKVVCSCKVLAPLPPLPSNTQVSVKALQCPVETQFSLVTNAIHPIPSADLL